MPFIQLRRGSAIPTGERHLVGEPMWDPTSSRFGVFNNRAPEAMEWYPCVIGNKLLLNPNQTLGGKILAGSENNVYLDFSVQNQVTIKNRNSGVTLATFSEAGAAFNALGVSGAARPGLLNMLQNGNLSVRRGLFPVTAVDTNIAAQRSTLVAPNWQLWKTANTAGRIVLSYDNTPGASDAFAPGAGIFMLNVSSAPNSSGLRTFLHGYPTISGLDVTFSWYFFAASGQTSYHRAISENGSLLFSKQITGNGAWQRVVTSFNAPEDGSRWAGFDVFYNPSGTINSNQIWKGTCAQLQLGNSASVFENRPESFERALCDAIYRESVVNLRSNVDSVAISTQNFPYGKKLVAVEANNRAVSITDDGLQSFTISVPTLPAASTVKTQIHMMPLVTETA